MVINDEVKTRNTWSNQDNATYYENVPIEEFRQEAILGGFENGCDIDIVYPHLKDTHSVLEVGAAYGRVIQCLLDRGYQGKITAIERSRNFFKYLTNTFRGKATIICADAETVELKDKFDAVLWMWSNISEWPKEQQLMMLGRIAKFCSPYGLLILDTFSHTLTPGNATTYEAQSYTAETDYGYVYGYVPSPEEIRAYGLSLGFNSIEQIPYKTSTDRDRYIHVLKR